MSKNYTVKLEPLPHTEPASAPDALLLAVTEALHTYRLSLEALGRSPNTIKSYFDILERYFSFLKNEDLLRPVNEMGRRELNDYLLHLKNCQRRPNWPPNRGDTGKLSPFTIQDHVRTIKVYWGWLFREGYIDKNPLEKFPLPSVPKLILKVITPELFQIILSYIDVTTPIGAQRYCILLLLYDVGLRIGELVNSLIENIDFNMGTIKVFGKRNKEREVPISRLTIREIRRYIRNFRPNICPVESPYLFPRADGIPISINGIQQFMRRLSKKPGINGLKLHPHLFRHSFGTQFIINGGNVFYLKEIMGHESLSTTLKYTHLQPKDLCLEHAKFSPVWNLRMGKKFNGTLLAANEK
jgi:site-specific recombinase XerD